MTNLIYRGFEVVQQGAVFQVLKDGQEVHRADREEAALNWIDAEKRRQRSQA